MSERPTETGVKGSRTVKFEKLDPAKLKDYFPGWFDVIHTEGYATFTITVEGDVWRFTYLQVPFDKIREVHLSRHSTILNRLGNVDEVLLHPEAKTASFFSKKEGRVYVVSHGGLKHRIETSDKKLLGTSWVGKPQEY